ncbi:alpha/beta hydrolase [Cellulophaga sp. Z1A5H]|uniref:alpha/beta hydrolase n=1 Tax=Cellulophaga sp. Z1A5H TaxID=2687291 RepID=UPI0013FDBF9B|nr:alpha/beta hydrolase-fold protein [Cellulophaga sp. Z1A5H]
MKILFYTLCLFSIFSNAQTIEIGTIEKIQSTILNEEREYWVSLPENYANEKYETQKYPVVYLLDGEKYFHTVTGMVKNLSNGYYPQIPECIVIAIKNTNRSRDLTPTIVTDLSYESGGADKFEAFITDELIPQVNNNYNTLDYKILIGHSFGGLFAFNLALKNISSFNSYIVLDPSLWWDNNTTLQKLEHTIKTKDFRGTTLFFANANSIGNQKEPSKQHYAHFEAKKTSLKLLEDNLPKNLNFYSKYYKDEDHGSVVLPSLIDGLRTVFEGFRINVKELIKNPSILERDYQLLSDKIGFNFKPQSTYIDRVVDLALKQDEKENAKILHNLNKKLYPKNTYLKHKIEF